MPVKPGTAITAGVSAPKQGHLAENGEVEYLVSSIPSHSRHCSSRASHGPYAAPMGQGQEGQGYTAGRQQHDARWLGGRLAEDREGLVRRWSAVDLTPRSGVLCQGFAIAILEQGASARVLDVELAADRVARVGHVPEPLAAGQLGAIHPCGGIQYVPGDRRGAQAVEIEVAVGILGPAADAYLWSMNPGARQGTAC